MLFITYSELPIKFLYLTRLLININNAVISPNPSFNLSFCVGGGCDNLPELLTAVVSKESAIKNCLNSEIK